MTRYVDVQDLSRLVQKKGLATCLSEMAEYIRQDYLRWHDFEKCARLANHSPDGVIELMPVSDAALYAFIRLDGVADSLGLAMALAGLAVDFLHQPK